MTTNEPSPSIDPTARRVGAAFLVTGVIAVALGLLYGTVGRWAMGNAPHELARGTLRAHMTALSALVLLPAVLGTLVHGILPLQEGEPGGVERGRARFGAFAQVLGTALCFGGIAFMGHRYGDLLLIGAVVAGGASLASTSLRCLGAVERIRRTGSETVLAAALRGTAAAALLVFPAVIVLAGDRLAQTHLTAASSDRAGDLLDLPAGLLLVPAIGVASEVLATFARRRIAGTKTMNASLTLLANVSVGAWALRWFASPTTGQLATWAESLIDLALGGVVVLAWLLTLRGTGARMAAPMYAVVGLMIQLAVGLFVGVVVWPGAGPAAALGGTLDAAHAHYLFTGVPLLALLAASAYWAPRIAECEPNGSPIGVLLVFVGYQVGLLSELRLGLAGIPRDLPGVEDGVSRALDAVGVSLVLIGCAVAGGELLAAFRRGGARANPWGSLAPEWSGATGPDMDPYGYDRTASE